RPWASATSVPTSWPSQSTWSVSFARQPVPWKATIPPTSTVGFSTVMPPPVGGYWVPPGVASWLTSGSPPPPPPPPPPPGFAGAVVVVGGAGRSPSPLPLPSCWSSRRLSRIHGSPARSL